MRGRFLLVLIQTLPITGHALVADPFRETRIKMIAKGGYQPTPRVGFQDQAGQSVAVAIDEPGGVGGGIKQAGSFGDSGIK